MQAGLGEAALPFLERAHELEPDRWEHLSNLGAAYRIVGEFDKSVMCLSQALMMNTRSSVAWNNMSNTLESMGNFEESVKAAQCSFDINPSRDAALSLSWLLLRDGKWEEGLPLWEFGRVGNSWNPIHGIPVWKGEDIAGKRLLIIREGGYGDTFMFFRFFAQLKDMLAKVTFLVWDRQADILEGNSWIDKIHRESEQFNPSDFDYHCPIMSLPFILDVKRQLIPKLWTYLEAKKEHREIARKVLANGGKPKVGVCWSAEENGVARRTRALDVSELSEFRSLPARFISLSRDAKAPDWMESYPQLMENWDATAGLISSLDVVVTVDTSIAHLAGCLGKQAIVILPVNACWRWLRDRKDSMWYKNMVLARSTDPLSFAPAIKEAKEVLSGFLH